MASRALCLICGCQEDEVEKMHYFPSNLEKSKIWQENMGIKYCGFSLRNYRICSRHFSSNSYADRIRYKLYSNAVPTLFPATHLATKLKYEDEVV